MPSTASAERSQGVAAIRIRWTVVAGLVVLGVAMLLGGARASGYSQSLLSNLGATALMFAFIYFIQQKLIETVEHVSGPRTLREAQDELAELLRRSRGRGGGLSTAKSVTAARNESIGRVTKALTRSGLKEQPPRPGSESVGFADEAGLTIRWTVAWTPPGLRHEVVIEDPPSPGRPMQATSTTPRPLSGGTVTVEDQRQLQEFEGEVFFHLRAVVQALSDMR